MINPELHYCNCGYTFKFNRWQKILMLVKGDYVYRCPRCQSVMKFKLINHVVKVGSKKVLSERIWENG